jgi:translation initiation factor IF-2
MAANTSGYVIGFNMRPVTSARKLAELKGVDVRTYSIIYELIDDVTAALEGMLTPESVEKYIGRAEVKDTFTIPKIGTIAGCGVIDGKIERGCNIRLLREGKIMFDGKLSTLKRFKDEVKEVGNGYECGMALEGHNDIKNNDLIEAYILEKKERKLESASN